MAYIGNFNAEHIPSPIDFSALPSGHYLMAITDSEMKPTKNGSGQYLQLVFTVLEAQAPEAINRKVFIRLNLINPNQTAVDIAQRELSAICHALGILQITDSQQLHDRPLCCKVQYIPAKGDFNESNKINAYQPASEYRKAPISRGPAQPTHGHAPPPVASRPAVAPKPMPPTPPAVPAIAPWRNAPAQPAAQASA